MSVLPPECHPVLLVYPDAVPTRLIALQSFQPIAGGYRDIVEAASGVEQFQFPLNHAPQFSRYSSSVARVSFAKQVGRRVVAK